MASFPQEPIDFSSTTPPVNTSGIQPAQSQGLALPGNDSRLDTLSQCQAAGGERLGGELTIKAEQLSTPASLMQFIEKLPFDPKVLAQTVKWTYAEGESKLEALSSLLNTLEEKGHISEETALDVLVSAQEEKEVNQENRAPRQRSATAPAGTAQPKTDALRGRSNSAPVLASEFAEAEKAASALPGVSPEKRKELSGQLASGKIPAPPDVDFNAIENEAKQAVDNAGRRERQSAIKEAVGHMKGLTEEQQKALIDEVEKGPAGAVPKPPDLNMGALLNDDEYAKREAQQTAETQRKAKAGTDEQLSELVSKPEVLSLIESLSKVSDSQGKLKLSYDPDTKKFDAAPVGRRKAFLGRSKAGKKGQEALEKANITLNMLGQKIEDLGLKKEEITLPFANKKWLDVKGQLESHRTDRL